MSNNQHWSEERWDRLINRLCADFGLNAASKILEVIVYEIGGERMTIPSIKDLEHRERDRRICNSFRGDYKEIALRFHLSENTIRRIILKQRIIDRTRNLEEYSP